MIFGLRVNVEKLFKEKLKPYFDPREHCKGCLFALNNKKVGELSNMDKEDLDRLNKKLLTNQKPHHIEFP